LLRPIYLLWGILFACLEHRPSFDITRRLILCSNALLADGRALIVVAETADIHQAHDLAVRRRLHLKDKLRSGSNCLPGHTRYALAKDLVRPVVTVPVTRTMKRDTTASVSYLVISMICFEPGVYGTVVNFLRTHWSPLPGDYSNYVSA
jgi:hypothetical protein